MRPGDRRSNRLTAVSLACALGLSALGLWAPASGCSSGDDDAGAPGPAGASGSTAAAGAGNGSVAGVGSGTSGSAASGSGAGGAAAGEGSSTASAADSSMTDACLEYSAARVRRFNECAGGTVRDEEDIERGIQDCPDQYFSEGSTRTVAGLLDCAEQVRNFPCEEIVVSRVPPCVTPGTRVGGESCVYLTQCASLRCSGGGIMCGTCAAAAGPGEACDDSTVTCGANYSCEAGVCVEIPIEPPPPPPPPPDPPATKPTGAECANHAECTGEDLCFDDNNGGPRVCMARVELGGFCGGPIWYCHDADYCDPTDDTCKVPPGQGEPCGLHFGEPSVCGEHLQCVISGTDATCQPTPGFECQLAGLDCESGSTCCASPDCPTPTCLRGLKPGDACDVPDARCVHGSQCVAGTCQVDDSLTEFAERCGMP